MNQDINKEIEKCISVLGGGGLILYPTDTVWGIGCDATNKNSIDRIFALKQRSDNKALIILAENKNIICEYVMEPDIKIFEYLDTHKSPTTVIFKNAMNLPSNLIANDKSIAIRIPKDPFCQSILQSFKKPIVSTSANISGNSTPRNFQDIKDEIKNGVDYVVQHRRNDKNFFSPSSIITIGNDSRIKVIRY